MSENTLIQIRVDNKLKSEATDVLDKIGIDMPTAIRMFLKRITIEQGIPFSTSLPTKQSQQSREMNDVQKRIIKIPAKKSVEVPRDLVEDLIRQIPKGKLTRREDIAKFFADLHNVEVAHLEPISIVTVLQDETFPCWRVVSKNGFIPTKSPYCSEEKYIAKLKAEGHGISKGGAKGALYKVDDYKQCLFNFQDM